MKTKFWVYSGGRPSNGAKELAACDGFLRLRPGRFHKVKPDDIVINWGVTSLFKPGSAYLLNRPQDVLLAANKLTAFEIFDDNVVSAVPWTTDQVEAQEWATSGKTVVVRNKLTGSSGDGIVIVNKYEEVPDAPLYTQYIFKAFEFRVHVCAGKVIDTQKKIRDPDKEVTNWKVRSHENGFIFTRNSVLANPLRDKLAIDSALALGLDFGAVDIIQDDGENFYVLEVNTAPGLEGQTIKSYAEGFNAYQG
jgi:glutathione synthase/RimK-type ligase-like ATP-grasp enzyme